LPGIISTYELAEGLSSGAAAGKLLRGEPGLSGKIVELEPVGVMLPPPEDVESRLDLRLRRGLWSARSTGEPTEPESPVLRPLSFFEFLRSFWDLVFPHDMFM